MRGILYEHRHYAFWVFLILTVLLGGAAGLATGRAVAKTWRAYRQVAIYAVAIAAAVRFLHFALFGETLLSPQYYIIALVIVLAAGSLGYRQMRVRQMVTQYSFAFQRSGPFHWHARARS